MLGYGNFYGFLTMDFYGDDSCVTITFIDLIDDDNGTYTSYPGELVDSSGVFGLLCDGVNWDRFNLRFWGYFNVTGLTLLGNFAGTGGDDGAYIWYNGYTRIGDLINFTGMLSSFAITSGGVFGTYFGGRFDEGFAYMDAVYFRICVLNASFGITTFYDFGDDEGIGGEGAGGGLTIDIDRWKLRFIGWDNDFYKNFVRFPIAYSGYISFDFVRFGVSLGARLGDGVSNCRAAT